MLRQIAALRYVIFNAKNGTNLSRRVLAFLVNSSERLTKEVCLSLVADREGYTADEISAAVHGIGSMKRSNGTTHLDQILVAMGSELCFSLHYGDFDSSRRPDNPLNTEGQFPGGSRDLPLRYTFWLSKERHSRQATLVVATRKELEQIDLGKPGLYPSFESA